MLIDIQCMANRHGTPGVNAVELGDALKTHVKVMSADGSELTIRPLCAHHQPRYVTIPLKCPNNQQLSAIR